MSTPSDWLYEPVHTRWLDDAALVAMLPLHLRLFARYCRLYRRHRPHEPVPGGRRAFELAAVLGRRLAVPPAVRLDVGPYVVYLDPFDPRMLHVPNELAATGKPARLLARLLAAGDTFVDVGANHGTLSILAAQRVGPRGRIIAIEPNTRLAPLVRRSLACQIPAVAFEIHACACGDRDEIVEMFVPASSSGIAGLYRAMSATERHYTLRVAMHPLDSLLAGAELPGRVVVKLDVEGSELAVLRGAARTIAAYHPTIILEVNNRSLRAAGVDRAALVAELADRGYHRYRPDTDLDRELELTALVGETARNIIVS